MLFIEKWAWSNNYWPHPLKIDMVLYCTSVPTHPPNFRKIRVMVAEKTLTQSLCKDKERRMTFDPWIFIGHIGQTSKFFGMTWLTPMPKFNPVICIGQNLRSNLNLTFEWPLTPWTAATSTCQIIKFLGMIWHSPTRSNYNNMTLIWQKLHTYLNLTFKWPLTPESS